jgi:hypothetical protein
MSSSSNNRLVLKYCHFHTKISTFVILISSFFFLNYSNHNNQFDEIDPDYAMFLANYDPNYEHEDHDDDIDPDYYLIFFNLTMLTNQNKHKS